MTEPRLAHVQCLDSRGLHRMAYWEWGDAANPRVLLCVHGLNRQGRDFDKLARDMADSYRVVCPDVVGRGRSDWLKDPSGYQIPAYAGDMLALLAQLRPGVLDWVGTSMGGLIGMVVAGQPGLPLPVPVRRLVLNDVGPAIRWAAIERIKTYLGDTGRFESLEAAAAAMRAISASFGPHTDAQWLALSRPMVRPLEGQGGALTLHYDPAIAVPVRATTAEASAQGEALLWQLYDNIQARTLLTRGADSDMLTPDTAAAMAQRGPKARVVEFAGVGHAPTFVADDQVACVADFLLG